MRRIFGPLSQRTGFAGDLSTASSREEAETAGDSMWPCAPEGEITRTPFAAGQEAQRPVHLTVRQKDVLALLCEGLPNKLICRKLKIAMGTVKVHIAAIFRELGVADRLQAVIAAQRLGLVAEPPDGAEPARVGVATSARFMALRGGTVCVVCRSSADA